MIKSPCVNRCNGHLTCTGTCTGCKRTIEEQRDWVGYTDKEKLKVLNRIKKDKFDNNRE